MSDIIKLVAGDNLPNIQVTLTNKSTGAAIDLSPIGTVITVKMRTVGTTAVLATLSGTPTNGGADGVFSFAFPGTALLVPAAQYEFEISVSFNGAVETVYDLIRAQVRARF
jgi:hypothetical protein